MNILKLVWFKEVIPFSFGFYGTSNQWELWFLCFRGRSSQNLCGLILCVIRVGLGEAGSGLWSCVQFLLLLQPQHCFLRGGKSGNTPVNLSWSSELSQGTRIYSQLWFLVNFPPKFHVTCRQQVIPGITPQEPVASSEPEMMQAANSASGKLAHHCP